MPDDEWEYIDADVASAVYLILGSACAMVWLGHDPQARHITIRVRTAPDYVGNWPIDMTRVLKAIRARGDVPKGYRVSIQRKREVD